MPSMLHEGLVALFRNRPSLAAELATRALGVNLPRFDVARIGEADLSQLVPTEYRADLVVHYVGAEVAFGMVVEVQLSIDDHKRFVWPLYAAALRAKLRCPCCLLVVAPHEKVARWARRPIDVGQPGSRFRPLVVGSKAVPVIVDENDAAQTPELAVLSVMAHGREPGAEHIAAPALRAAIPLADDVALLYSDLIRTALSPAARRALEELMKAGGYEYQSDFARKYFGQGRNEGLAEGRNEGLAEAILRLLERRKLSVDEKTRQRIIECRDVAALERWFDRAVTASTIEEVLAS